jgi:hypothetical protein
MCGVVPDILTMVFGSGGASSVIRRLGRYTDGLFWCCVMRGGRCVGYLAAMWTLPYA